MKNLDSQNTIPVPQNCLCCGSEIYTGNYEHSDDWEECLGESTTIHYKCGSKLFKEYNAAKNIVKLAIINCPRWEK